MQVQIIGGEDRQKKSLKECIIRTKPKRINNSPATHFGHPSLLIASPAYHYLARLLHINYRFSSYLTVWCEISILGRYAKYHFFCISNEDSPRSPRIGFLYRIKLRTASIMVHILAGMAIKFPKFCRFKANRSLPILLTVCTIVRERS